jgi:hypothetical protein
MGEAKLRGTYEDRVRQSKQLRQEKFEADIARRKHNTQPFSRPLLKSKDNALIGEARTPQPAPQVTPIKIHRPRPSLLAILAAALSSKS